MSSENTVYIAIELSVSSWPVAARLPNTNKARLHRLECGTTTALLKSYRRKKSSSTSASWRRRWISSNRAYRDLVDHILGRRYQRTHAFFALS